jgi:hypothetical protein
MAQIKAVHKDRNGAAVDRPQRAANVERYRDLAAAGRPLFGRDVA